MNITRWFKTYRLAELARDAALLSTRVPPQDVLPAEPRAQRALLERIVDLQGQGNRQSSCTALCGWPEILLFQSQRRTVTFLSKNIRSVSDIPRIISVRKRVCALLSRTAGKKKRWQHVSDSIHFGSAAAVRMMLQTLTPSDVLWRGIARVLHRAVVLGVCERN